MNCYRWEECHVKYIRKSFFLFWLIAVMLFGTVSASAASAKPETPVLSGTAAGNRVTLNWNKVKKASGYQIFLYSASDFCAEISSALCDLLLIYSVKQHIIQEDFFRKVCNLRILFPEPHTILRIVQKYFKRIIANVTVRHKRI